MTNYSTSKGNIDDARKFIADFHEELKEVEPGYQMESHNVLVPVSTAGCPECGTAQLTKVTVFILVPLLYQ